MYIVWLPISDEKPKVFGHLLDARKYANSQVSDGEKGEMAHIYDVSDGNPATAVQIVGDGKVPVLEYVGRKATSEEIDQHRRAAAIARLRKLGMPI